MHWRTRTIRRKQDESRATTTHNFDSSTFNVIFGHWELKTDRIDNSLLTFILTTLLYFGHFGLGHLLCESFVLPVVNLNWTDDRAQFFFSICCVRSPLSPASMYSFPFQQSVTNKRHVFSLNLTSSKWAFFNINIYRFEWYYG